MAKNTEKREKWNMHTVGPRIWQKKMKKRGKWESHTVGSGIWQKKKKKKKSENGELQKRTLQDLEYVRENWKIWKIKKAHYMKSNMVRNTEKRGKWEMHTIGLDYGEKTEKRGKW